MAAEGAARDRSRSRGAAGGSEVHAGCRVRLHGLKAAADLNGQHGIADAFVAGSGRWRVKLDSGLMKDLKAENLEATEPEVMFTLPTAAQAPGNSEISLHPGCTVKLHSLTGALELNGKEGTLEMFIGGTARWRVRLDGGQHKDLKPDNLRALEPEVMFAVPEAATATSMKQQQNSGQEASACTQGSSAAQQGQEGPPQQSDPCPETECTGNQDLPQQVFTGPSTQVRVAGYSGETIDLQPGELCGPSDRFMIATLLGEGAFSTVWRCKDTQSRSDYAMKITRNTDRTTEALKREITLMQHLQTRAFKWDPEGSQHLLCLAFLEGFDVKGHLGVLFEPMKYNLLSALKRHGHGNGLPLLPTIRNFGKNLFLALRALRQASVIHFDVKPDNLLVTKDGESVKLADFGCALIVSEAENLINDEMMPRFYRAPEVMLGQQLGTPVDMWSAGATLYQVATDRFLFSGGNNNAVIHEMLAIGGGFPAALAASGKFASRHFDAAGDFLLQPPASSTAAPRKIPMTTFNPAPRPLSDSVKALLKEPPVGVDPDRHEFLLGHFSDLVCSCLNPDQAARATPDDAVNHRFFGKRAGDPLADLCAIWAEIDHKKAKGIE